MNKNVMPLFFLFGTIAEYPNTASHQVFCLPTQRFIFSLSSADNKNKDFYFSQRFQRLSD